LSFNVYEMDRTIHYDGDNKTTEYGFRIVSQCEGFDVCCFGSEDDRNKWVDHVASLIPHERPFELAGVLVLAAVAESDDMQNCGSLMLKEELGDPDYSAEIFEVLEEIRV